MLCLVGCGALASGCGARQTRDHANTQAGQAQPKGQHIVLTEARLAGAGIVADTVRFGRIRSGEIAQLRLWLTNRTERTLVVVGYERSCGCTSLEFSGEPIRPGASQSITLGFDSRGEYGWQLRPIDILVAGAQKGLADKENPVRLIVEAQVE